MVSVAADASSVTGHGVTLRINIAIHGQFTPALTKQQQEWEIPRMIAPGCLLAPAAASPV
jgi:hypothetical protein